MSELREQLQRAREAYGEIRYPGDLGELALAEPARTNTPWKVLAACVAIAASLAAVALWPETPGAVTPPSPVAAAPAPTAEETTPRKAKPRIGLMAQMRRLDRLSKPKRLTINRPRAVIATTSSRIAPAPLTIFPTERWKLAPAATPTPPEAVADASAAPTDPPPPAFSFEEPKWRRRGSPSPPFALRSMSHAISLGT